MIVVVDLRGCRTTSLCQQVFDVIRSAGVFGEQELSVAH